jgi:hypothetical protein
MEKDVIIITFDKKFPPWELFFAPLQNIIHSNDIPKYHLSQRYLWFSLKQSFALLTKGFSL